MTREQLAQLQPGDIIRPVGGAEAMIVTANYGNHAVAVRTVHVANPGEWELVAKPPAPDERSSFAKQQEAFPYG